MSAHESGPASQVVQRLKRSVEGRVLVPGDPGYNAARKLFNGMIDRRPAALVQVETVDDVRRALEAARALRAAAVGQGGGHNVAGSALSDGGIVIDFSRQRHVVVDPAGPGSPTPSPGRGGPTSIRPPRRHGLATTGGLVSEHRHRGLHAGGRHRLARAQARSGRRQPDRRGAGHCRRRGVSR